MQLFSLKRQIGALALTLVMASLSLVSPAALAANNKTVAQAAQPVPESTRTAPPSAGAMAFDALVVRPVSFVGTVLGSALFVASLPFSALGGNVGEAGHQLVVVPGKFTFDRPLGNFADLAPY